MEALKETAAIFEGLYRYTRRRICHCHCTALDLTVSNQHELFDTLRTRTTGQDGLHAISSGRYALRSEALRSTKAKDCLIRARGSAGLRPNFDFHANVRQLHDKHGDI
jgi:hypothetical protein